MFFLVALLAVSALASAYDIPYNIENELLYSARQADMHEFAVRTGVFAKDLPKVDPHWACVRLSLFEFEKNRTNPYFSGTLSYIDRISCLPNSHTSNMRKLIRAYEATPTNKVYLKMRSHMAYEVLV